MEHEMEEEAASIKHEIEDGQMNTHNLTTEVKTRAKKRNSSTFGRFLLTPCFRG